MAWRAIADIRAPMARLACARDYNPAVRKRLCYIHVGPHKTGTTSIQWFLQENRAQFLEHGYFVPKSETKRGAHHALAEKLCGLDVGEHREPLVARLSAELLKRPQKQLCSRRRLWRDSWEVQNTRVLSSATFEN